MDSRRIGALIRVLRIERALTQRQLAERLGVSDKAVSKWERGGGCPDVGLLSELAGQLGTSVETLLQGNLSPNQQLGGSMKRLTFRLCPICGNIITTTGDADIACCGRTLTPLEMHDVDDNHSMNIQSIEGDWYLTFEHPMNKQHYLSFIAAVGYDRIALEKLYPEQGGEARIPQLPGAVLYTYCTNHGLMRHCVR